MDFIVEGCELNKKFQGYTILTFDPSNYLSKPKLKYYTIAELENACQSNLNPQGFTVKDGYVYSQGPINIIFLSTPEELEQYVNSINNSNSCIEDNVGLLDILLQGIHSDWYILPYYDESEDISKLPLLSMADLKVSSSSMNIYIPYIKPNGEYSTLSLIDQETLTANEFILCLPKDDLGALNKLSNKLSSNTVTQISNGTVLFDNEEHIIVRISEKLIYTPIFCGSGFVNYLAYMSAFFHTGGQVLSFFSKLNTVSKQTASSSRKPRQAKKYSNVKITSEFYGKSYIEEMYSAIINNPSNMNEICDLIVAEHKTACFTPYWIGQIINSPLYIELLGKGFDFTTAMQEVAISLMPAHHQQALIFDINLLAIRYYIQILASSKYGVYVSGGGKDGKSHIRKV